MLNGRRWRAFMSSGCWTFYDAFKSKARKRTVCEHNFVKKKKPVKRDVCVFHIYIYDVSFSDLLFRSPFRYLLLLCKRDTQCIVLYSLTLTTTVSLLSPLSVDDSNCLLFPVTLVYCIILSFSVLVHV